MPPLQAGVRAPAKESGNPYQSPLANSTHGSTAGELRGASWAKLKRFGELLARAWRAPPAAIACALVAAGLTIAQLKLINL